MKEVYQIVMDTDAVAPAIGSTLEWLKAIGGEHLPTDFEEMELDCKSALRDSADSRLWTPQLRLEKQVGEGAPQGPVSH